MKKIVRLLPKKRQTMLFSATTTKKTEDLVAVALKKEPIYIGIEEKNKVGFWHFPVIWDTLLGFLSRS